MPIKEGIEYGVNEALDNLRSKPISTTPDLPLATRINLLKDKDPKKYQEYMQRLIQAEKDGNEEARKLLGEIGEDVGRSRRGYEWLGTAMTFAPMLPVAGSVFNAVKSFATNPINIEVAKTVGKNALQGMLDYTLADGAVRTVTGKDIMTNVNNSVKHVFGDNEYTDFATQYVTPMAPIPVFGTGNFTKNVMTAGKNIIQTTKQYPELLYQIDKAALTALNKTGVGNWLKDKDYKWLDRDIPFYNTIFDYRLPKAVRDKVHRDSHKYHFDQLQRLGDIGYIISYDKTRYSSPTIREQINNSLGLNKGTAKQAKAAAWPDENKIKFYIEGLGKKDDPIGSLYHEKRHLIQMSPFEVPMYSRLQAMPEWSNLNDSHSELLKSLSVLYNQENANLIPAASRLYKTKYEDSWYKLLAEFDAEIANFRRDDLRPYHMMDDLSKARIKRLASERFGISEDDADFIATELSINGYKNGGKTKQAE